MKVDKERLRRQIQRQSAGGDQRSRIAGREHQRYSHPNIDAKIAELNSECRRRRGFTLRNVIREDTRDPVAQKRNKFDDCEWAWVVYLVVAGFLGWGIGWMLWVSGVIR